MALVAGPSVLAQRRVLPDSVESFTRKSFKSHQWKAGKEMLDRHWEDYGDYSAMNELMGQYFYNSRNYDKARFYLVRALRDDESNTNAREILAKVEEETGNYSSAICYVNEILAASPYNKEWWRRKIGLYRKQGNDIEADRLLMRLQQIFPEDDQVRNDILAMHEERFRKQRVEGDIQGQIESLRKLAEAYPRETEYTLSLSNLLLQSGRTTEAEQVLSAGVQATGDPTLIEKRAGIMGEQGRYGEAINYLKYMQKVYHVASLQKTIDEMELAAAEYAMLNDPYTAMAKVYARQHNREALTFLLNTSIARGYYDDALMYIKEAKGKGPGTEKLNYMEYTVHKRLGNRKAALGVLMNMFATNPDNLDVRDELSAMRYEDAIALMNFQQYQDAIPMLQFVENYAVDREMRKGAMLRLFNCYYETKQYTFAQRELDKLRDDYNYDNYYSQSASLLNSEGRIREALDLLAKAHAETTDPTRAQLLAYQYEEIAQPYIKSMIRRGMLRAADQEVKAALQVCPTSNDFLHQAITVSDLLGSKDDYARTVSAGRSSYPEDPFFVVKEAGLKADKGDYTGALRMIRPQLNVFMGDSTLTGAYAQHSIALATGQRKAKDYRQAIATLDSALVFRPKDDELLYNKGLVYEANHQYDSAYVYLRHYKPTLMDFQEHKRNLEEVRNQGYRNELVFMYQRARPGSEDVVKNPGSQYVLTANAMASYTAKREKNTFTFSVNYAGREGASEESMDKTDMESGGTGIMPGIDWIHHSPTSPWTYSLGAAWGSKYFPRYTFRAQVARLVKENWHVDLHASVRNMKTYTRRYSWIANPDKNAPEDPDSIYVSTGYNGRYDMLYQAGVGVQRDLDQWILMGTADAFLLKNKIYFNGQVKAQFFPVDNSRSHVFAMVGAGTAPQTELLDNSMPAGFSKLNTFVGAGLMWFLNRHVAAAVSGTWYTMYRTQDIQTGIWEPDYSTVTSTFQSDYKNVFYVQAQLVISF